MNETGKRFARLAACLIVLNVAGLFWIRHEWLTLATGSRPGQIVQVTATLPATGEAADSAERLSILFDQELGAASELNRLLDRQSPFLISPPVPGHWNWESGRQIDFVLDQPLPPGRRFEVVTAEGFAAQFAKPVQVSDQIEFRTSPLKLEACRLVTSDRHDVTFELKFNQKVVPGELLKKLTVRDSADDFETDPLQTDAGRPDRRILPVTSLVDEPDQSLVLRCRRPNSQRLQVRLAADLAGQDADDGLGEVVVRSVAVSPVFAFLRSEIDESRYDGFWDVDLFFTTGLDGRQSLPEIGVSPRPEQLQASLASTWRADGRVLRLSGKFESGKSYKVALPQTLLSADQKPLAENAEVRFRIPDRAADVEFPNGNGILSTNGNLDVELRTVNVGGLEVSASRVHANNLVAHLHGEWQTQTSRSLGDKTFRIDGARNESVSHVVALRDLLDDPAGLYRLEASATDRSWTRDTTLVTVTDLGLTLKQSPSELFVWVTSLRHATRVSGVRVRSVSYNNQTLAEGTTGEDGIARLKVDARHPDGRPFVVIAESSAEPGRAGGGDQIAWLQIGETQHVLDDVDQSGRPHPDTFDVMLFSDRGTYRPGETIRLTGIIRDEHGQVPPAFPVILDIVRPDGRTVLSSVIAAESLQDGVLQFEYATPEATYTGPWRFRLRIPGTDEPLAEQHVFVEEFIPVRLEVSASAQQPLVTGDEAAIVVVDSRYLFGTPAAGLSVSGHANYSLSRFRSVAFRDFQFGPGVLAERHDADDAEATLDAAGHADLRLPKVPGTTAGLWSGDVSVTVTEDGGRSVSTRTRVTIDTLRRHVGLKGAGVDSSAAGAAPVGAVPVGEEVALELVLRDAFDRHLAGERIVLELQRVERETVLQRVDGDYRWETIERSSSLWKRDVVFESAEVVTSPLTVSDAGLFRLVAVHEKSGSRTEIEFVARSGGAELAAVANRPGRLDVSLDRAICRPGESVTATVNSPFAGSLLVCLESDRVLWSRVVTVEPDKAATVSIEIPAALRGGAFVSATLLRAVDPQANEWMPHRAFGLARLATDHSAQRLPVTISASAQAEPQSPVRVEVQTVPGAQVLLWAVDEGILATTGFSTPNPHDAFFAPRQLAVTTADVFSRLLPDHRRAATTHRIGGDGPEGTDGVDRLRRNPVPAKRRELAVLWGGLKSVDANGKLVFETALPDFTGELRWMAVAIAGDRFGTAEQAMTVTAPLLAEASWPRFAAPGDRFAVPVKLFNATDGPAVVDLLCEVAGPVVVARRGDDSSDSEDAGGERVSGPQESGGSASDVSVEKADRVAGVERAAAAVPRRLIELGVVEVPAAGSRIVWLDVRATSVGAVEGALIARSSSAAAAATGVDSSKRDLRQRFALPVRSAVPLVTEREFVQVAVGSPAELKLSGKLAAGASRTKLTIASEPGLDLKPALDHLIDYPYGCVEQTTSQLRALLAAGEILKASSEESAGQGGAGQGRAVETLIDAGIARLWSLQTADGGLSYWPGYGTSHLWGSVYAAECLAQVRSSGQKLDERLSGPLMQYLADRLQRPDGDEIDSNLQAEICCVLSQLGQPPVGWMSVLSERLNEMDMAGRAQLALAWHHAGRRDRALAALPDGTIDLMGDTRYAGRFSSGTIGRARLLAALLQIDASHVWIPRLVTELQSVRLNGQWLSTLENALSIDALALRRRLAGDSVPFDGTVRIGDREVRVRPGSMQHLVLSDVASGLPISVDGAGSVSIEMATTGLPAVDPAVPVPDVDRGLQIRRRWVARNGLPLNEEAIRVGDLIFVELTVTSETGGTIESVAVVDALPAGFEVENPRLQTSDASSGDAADVGHAEFLDDRVVAFVSATRAGTPIRYAIRAVTSGSFVRPPVQASCMYNESLSSVSGTGHVIVREVRSGSVENLAEKPEIEKRR